MNMNLSDYAPAPRDDALSYPGSRPNSSYLFFKNDIYPIKMIQNKPLSQSTVLLPDGSEPLLDEQLLKWKSLPMDDRYVIIGYGSNANPAQLSVKFKDNSEPIPVIRGIMRGYDVVFSPLVASYGAIPATIEKSIGTEVEIWINFLDEEQIRIMDKSEGRGKNYQLVKIDDEAILDNGERMSPVYSYVASNGTLQINDKPIRFSTINAKNPKYQQMTELDMYEFFVKNYFKLQHSGDLIDFHKLVLSDNSYRQRFNEFLINKHAKNTKINFDVIQTNSFPQKKFRDVKIHE